MNDPFGPVRIVINPKAGRGAVDRSWPAVRDVLDDARTPYHVTVTEYPGHATLAAREAIEAGERYVVAIGGDGTVHEVVNGLMGKSGALNPDAILGVIAAGSGCDFVKTFGLPADPAASARSLLGDNVWGRIDIGRVSYVDEGGDKQSRWFANIAEAGLGADVVAAASHMPKWLGSSVYKIVAMKQIASHRPYAASVLMNARKARGTRVDAPLSEMSFEGPMSLLVVANCQFYGGGMKVAPRAIPSDGMLDVQIATGSRAEAIKVMQKISKGTHVPSTNIMEHLATRVTLEAEQPILIEADGEVLGTTPATFDLVPEALTLKI
ncbi:MAG: diacylglycerol/lipid kinase family protein [Actinomycetota bacterium]